MPEMNYGTQAKCYPCKDCEKREVGCHSNCKAYLEVKEYNEMIAEKMFADKGNVRSLTGLKINLRNRR